MLLVKFSRPFLSSGINVTGDLVSTMNSFPVLWIFIVMVIWFLRSVMCSILVSFYGLLGIVFFGFVEFRTFFKFLTFEFFNFACFREVFFYNYDKFILELDIYGPDSNLVRRNIYNFVRLISYSVLFRIFLYVLFLV